MIYLVGLMFFFKLNIEFALDIFDIVDFWSSHNFSADFIQSTLSELICIPFYKTGYLGQRVKLPKKHSYTTPHKLTHNVVLGTTFSDLDDFVTFHLCF